MCDVAAVRVDSSFGVLLAIVCWSGHGSAGG